MRNLFLKIFLWFCLAFLMIAATLFVGTLITGMNESLRKEILNRISLYLPLEAKLAADIYEHDGPAGLKNHLHRMNQSGDVDAYIFDASGKDVLGRSPSADGIEVARSTSDAEPFVGRVGNRGSFAAQQTVATSGHRYTILLVIPAPSMIKMAGRLGFSRLFGLLTIILVGGGFCFLLARHISNPVVQLSTAAGRIADGWLDTRSDQSIRSRRDEIGRLGRSFDRMAERIESLVQGQQRLLGDVSHELRSPLARLSVAEGLLRQCPPEERTEYLDRIESEVEHLDQLIGQLLTLARINSGADPSPQETVDLTSLVQELAVDGNFEAQTKQCAVVVYSSDPCATRATKEQLRRAIENVVRNAIRYSQPNSKIEITIDRQIFSEHSWAVVQVRDHGPGVSAQHLEKIFQPFYRVLTNNAEQTGGAGLGLAITDRIVRMYGGTVKATNASTGGLVVHLELPLAV
ncbi:ATP-binding protein [Granulicella sp. S156]|uniref:sensor histidine kinase n=1 Tax=Granulicella sp. S156 TaxID=1747224 RepID=UPI00131C8C28|nr:ATP-binding protein [Granulicella sp. S156]